LTIKVPEIQGDLNKFIYHLKEGQENARRQFYNIVNNIPIKNLYLE